MPDKSTRERYDDLLAEARFRASVPRRPDLQLMPTGDDAPPSSDPLLDRLERSVDALQGRSGKRRRPKLTVVKGGHDDV